MVKKLEGAGLRGQVAGETSLSTVGQIEGLAYRPVSLPLTTEYELWGHSATCSRHGDGSSWSRAPRGQRGPSRMASLAAHVTPSSSTRAQWIAGTELE